MTITDFLQGRNVERQAVTRYISRHKKEFGSHITKNGREIEIDEVAYEILDKQYPMPQPIQIIEDTESRKELIKAQREIIELQKLVNQQEKTISKLQNMQLRLEYQEQENEDLKEKIKKLESRTWIDVLFKR